MRKLFLTFTLILSFSANAEYVYIYQGTDGVTVMDDEVPAEYLRNGYEVVNHRGELIKLVEPAPDFELNPVFEPSKEDRMLMASYSSEGEIREHMLRKINKLKMDIQSVELDIKMMAANLRKKRAEQDRIKARGGEVPESLIRQIERCLELEQMMAHQLKARLQQIPEIKYAYEHKIQRFALLSDIGVDQLLGN